MASTSGTKGPFEISRQPSKRMIRAPTRTVELPNEENIRDSEIVPSSLAVLVPILRAAIDIEVENPRVAYLCRFHAFEKAHTMDPTSSGRGVRQFKTYLLHKLEREGEITEKHTKRTDARELQSYYQTFYETKIRDGEFTKKPEEMVRNVQIATVLYEVLKTLVTPQTIEEKTKRYAADVEKKKGQYEHYNILPLYAVGAKPVIMELPEIKAAIAALSKVDNLPLPLIHSRPDNDDSTMPMERVKNVNDILDWIASIFGFQKGNVANQREHLILLLANMDIRNRSASYEIREETVEKLMATTFKNYESWCQYVRCKSNIRYGVGHDKQQLDLIYIALYLLIWGEASNIRFMPECLCYIFHHMCNDVYGILYSNAIQVSGDEYQIVTRDDEHFLREVITPLYDVLMKEAKRSNKGKASHANWRNYDDLNEYFWSDKCFKLNWPMNLNSDFFRHNETQTANQGRGRGQTTTGAGKKKPKTNFVEVRTYLHLYRSFDRMWIFFILALQAMIIIAWSNLGLIGVLTDDDVFRNVSSIFISYAILNFFQVTIDIILVWNALRNMKFTQLLRYFLKFVVAAVWVVVLPVSFRSSLQNPSGLIEFVTHWAGDWGPGSLYYYVVAIYMIPNIVAAILFFLPPMRRTLERSNMRIVTLLMWWAQPKLYVGRGMHESMFSLIKYTLFWIMLLISKLAFSYYVEISPLVEPTKLIMAMHIDNYQWHEVFPENDIHNLSVVISIWAPIILVYFMDTQIWYAIYATLFGGIIGAFSHLGEIRTLGMLRSRFQSVPLAFSESFWTGRNRKNIQEESDDAYERDNIAYFSQVWNEFINSMREEDLIGNRDRDLLLVPYSSVDVSVIQWPPFLLASKDNYYEEAFKMRNVLEEFHAHKGQRKPTILGLREHIFTGSVSSLAWFMSNQETSFVTIGQRVLANPLKVRFHYGHPDIFDRIFHITRGGISKASKTINLSEDIFAGYNSTLRQGYITHHEYIQVGKGRDVGLNQISLFEAKVANGNGEQTLCRDVYRLGRRFDFFRMLSFYFTTVGFYFSSMITVLTVYVFLYGRVYMVLSGVEREIIQSPDIHQSKALEQALASQSVVQLGLLLVLPMVMEIGLEKGFRTALGDFIIMQLQLASVFFTFQLGTKAHYYGRTLLHGGSKYRPTGRGFVVFHAKFADNYRMYSRSHFVKGLEILILLIIYEIYGESYRSSTLYFFITMSMWFLAISWLFAPFLFNPSGFDWQKTVDDWTDWKRWMGNRGGIGIPSDKSWESWWDEENEHLKFSNARGKILEILLACRFFIYQYGIVYQLNIARRSKSLLVFALSWGVLVIVLIVLKMVSMGRRRFGTDFQLMFRILKALLFLGFLSVMTVLFVVCALTVSDLFASILAFMPSGWAIILIAQTCRGLLKWAKLWASVKELSRAYEYVMGLIIFMPTAVLSWFPFVSEFQTRLLFNQAFSRGLQISMILAGKKDTYNKAE
ncbi:unnamed protein product [Lathyrus sativus]|nr:unnamed protein product [Lathyrus sativus]